MSKNIRFFVCSPVTKPERLNVQKGVLQGKECGFAPFHLALSHTYVLSCGLTPLKRPTCDLRQNPCQKAWSKTNCPPSSTLALSPRETLLRVYLQRDAAVQ